MTDTNKIPLRSDIVTLTKLSGLKQPSVEVIASLQRGIASTLEYAKILSSVDTDQVKATNDITGLSNVLRDDVIDDSRMFTQDEALSNARAQHDGYFVAEQALEQD